MAESTISVQRLQKLLNENEPVYILDVRSAEEREEWHIPKSIHFDVYESLKMGRQDVFDDAHFPQNTPIVTVCGAGKTSLIAAEVLAQKGYKTYSLEGGMKTWNYAWNTAELSLPETDVRIVQVRRSAKGCLSYVIGSGGVAIVVDAALDPQVYLNITSDYGWKIRYVMDTHIHADYLSRTRELSAASGAQHLFIAGASVDYSFAEVRDKQKLPFGNATLEILHTPGHTPESTCYLVDGKALFTGDTLFTDGVGRPDLKANKEEALQKAAQLYDSLQRLMQLPEETLVLPAHISQVVPFDGKMIGESLQTLKDGLELLNLQKEQFIAATLKRIPPAPPNYLTIASLNKKGNFEGHLPADLEAGANRCAVV